jgi:hypothetical protein
MMAVVGLGLLAIVLGFALFMVGIALDRDSWVYVGLGTCAVTLLLGGIGLALAMILGGFSGPRYVEGACYRAVRHTTTTLMPVGKVLIPTTTSGVSLEEIRCPS